MILCHHEPATTLNVLELLRRIAPNLELASVIVQHSIGPLKSPKQDPNSKRIEDLTPEHEPSASMGIPSGSLALPSASIYWLDRIKALRSPKAALEGC